MSNYDYIPTSEEIIKKLEKQNKVQEMVDHPAHYNVGEIEAIDLI